MKSNQPTKAISKDELFTANLPVGVKSSAKKLASEKNIFSCSHLCDQIFVMMGFGEKVNNRKKYTFTVEHISYMFRLKNPRMVLKYREQGEKIFLGTLKSPGRPSALTIEQDREVLEYIFSQEKQNLPLSPAELLEWVNETYNLDLQQSWPFGFQRQHEKDLCIKNAQPLESARASLTVNQLKEYGKCLQEVIVKYDYRLVFNWDETGVDESKHVTKSVIVSKQNEGSDTFYREPLKSGHLSLLATIGLTNDYIAPLLIISQKTMDSDLEHMGFPNSPIGIITSSNSGFITEDALVSYIKNSFGTSINEIRRKYNLEESRVLIIQDGLASHLTPNIKEALTSFKIDTFEIPPHSSHLTQPLDRGTFSMFKQQMKKQYYTSRSLTDRSLKIPKVFRSYERAFGLIQNLASFQHAGIEFSSNFGGLLKVNMDKVLKEDKAPQNIVIPETTPRNKIKTTRKTLSFHQTSTEKKKANKRKNEEVAELKKKRKK